MRIGLCQLNPIAGDVAGNLVRIKQTIARTADDHPDLLVFPELFLQGYPPRDLLENGWFVKSALDALDDLCRYSEDYPATGIIVGLALPDTLRNGRGLYNSAVLVHNGRVVYHQNKTLLPTYDVFDEHRYFDPAPEISVTHFKDEILGISICEDAWNEESLWDRPLYDVDPVSVLAAKGATILINISASPFHMGKQNLRCSIVGQHAKKHGLPFVFVNQTGGMDDLVFDGSSMYCDAAGNLCTILPQFSEDVRIVDTAAPWPPIQRPRMDGIANVYEALVMGVRDYMAKCGFTKAVLGLSGGIDSAVVAAIACAAVGPEHVLGITMPSRYSSDGSVGDSLTLAKNLGMECKQIPIEDAFSAYLGMLTPHFEGRAPDLAEENLQARIRGTALMALSNKLGHLLLTTGNKSEMAVGYCTLYGDMNGGLAVIADCFKTLVYKIAAYINRNGEVIPAAIIDKAPSAELRPDQKDQDSLPPYDELDAILALLLEEGSSSFDVIEKGHAKETVDWIVRAIRINEYKRRQSAPVLKITRKAFGVGRRYPIAARYVW